MHRGGAFLLGSTLPCVARTFLSSIPITGEGTIRRLAVAKIRELMEKGEEGDGADGKDIGCWILVVGGVGVRVSARAVFNIRHSCSTLLPADLENYTDGSICEHLRDLRETK